MNLTSASYGKPLAERAKLHSPDWLIWLIAIVCVWAGLGAYGVLNDNEGLYAQIPYDMIKSGDFTHWIIPHLNGLPYMEKPPLLYWLTALAFLVFGESEWVVRLVPTLSALSCVGSILYFGRRIYRPEVGRIAALMFISGLGVMIISRTLIFDMLMTALLTSALFRSYLYKMENHVRDLRIAYVSLALAVLTKGFVAILLFGLVTVSWIVLLYGASAWKKFRNWIDPVAIGLFFAITLPWFIAASWVEPIFPWFFFINEHVMRFLGLRYPHDFYSGPWWYYLPRIALYLFPWSILLPIAKFATWSKLSRIEKQEFVLLRKALILGWLVPLVFFSLSSAKANYYLIVAMPFATLNLALLLEQTDFLTGPRSMILGLVVAVCSAGFALGLQSFPYRLFPHLSYVELPILGMSWEHFGVLLLWTLVGLSVVAAVLAWVLPRVGIIAYVVLPLFFMAIMLIIVKSIDTSVSDRAIAEFIQHEMPDRTVYLYRNYEMNSSLAFYLKEPVYVIDSSSSDLYWGDQLRPENTIMVSRDQFTLQKESKVVVVANTLLGEFAHRKMHTKFIHNRQFGSATIFY